MDLGGVLRLCLSVVFGGRDSGGRGEFRGRYPLFARFRAARGAVCGDGADVLSVGYAALGDVVAGIVAFIVCVGASNVINFMDGINGITGGYALASLIPIYILNKELGFAEESLVVTVILADIVFCLFNFRPKGRAKCFAGDVGSIGIAFILLFLIGRLVMLTGDVTYLIFLLVYGVDGCCTIVHRIMRHENLGEAHRKHAYQLMANELKIGHVKISLFYMCLQLAISLAFVLCVPNTAWAHWAYLIGALLLLTVVYVLFMKKYFHLHEAYLASLNKTK